MDKIKIDISGSGKLTSYEIDALYDAMCKGLLTDSSDLAGQCTADGANEDAVNALHERFPRFSVETTKMFARIKDKEVLRVLLANAQHASPDGFTKEELEKITSIGDWFKGNVTIETFDELELTGVKSASFAGCTNLKSVGLRNLTSTDLSNTKVRVAYLKSVRTLVRFTGNNVITAVFTPSYAGEWDGQFRFETIEGSSLKIFDSGQYSVNVLNGLETYTGSLIVVSRSLSPDNNEERDFKYKRIYVPSSAIDAYKDKWKALSSKIFGICGSEWQEDMRELAAAEGYAKPDNIGWDYEYIDYLIYGCEPPTE